MLVVPVFGIQYVLTEWLSMETRHPLVELIQKNPDTWFFVCTGVAALVVAPVAEEFVFRVFLQGWLESVARVLPMPRGTDENQAGLWMSALVLGPQYGSAAGGEIPGETPQQKPEPEVVGDPIPEPVDLAPLGPLGGMPDQPLFPDQVGPVAWPIGVTSLLFAAAHFGHGADPIPLFFWGLGWATSTSARTV